jgi:hypothetical protein
VLIDCDTCAVRGAACGDCVVTVLLGEGDDAGTAPGSGPTELDERERIALATLADAGLVPPLRLTMPEEAAG